MIATRTVAAAAALFLVSGSALAQIEEIVVTAQKREQGANDIGITMNAFTGEMLQDFGFASAEDMALLTPGLTVNETAATGVPLYTIRGVGYQDYSTAASSTVGLYFDEVAIPYTVMSRGLMFDVERVEVLKGPQGDLYGRNTTAGQINFVSRKPTEDVRRPASVPASAVTAPSTSRDSSAAACRTRFAAACRRASCKSGEGWQKSATRDDELGKKDVLAVRGLLDIDLSETASLLLNVHFVDDQSDNKANTAYDGTIVGLGPFSNPYQPLNEYFLPRRHQLRRNAAVVFDRRQRSRPTGPTATRSVQTGRSFDLQPRT